MSYYTDGVKISMGTWEIVRLERGEDKGKPFGLHLLTGTDYELQGEDFLTTEEALELRDYINKHFGELK